MGCATSCQAQTFGDELSTLSRTTLTRTEVEGCPRLLRSSLLTTSLSPSRATYPLHRACKGKDIQAAQQVLSLLSHLPEDVIQEFLLPYCRRVGLPPPDTVAKGVRLAVNMRDANGKTPLMHACCSDSPELVKLLLEQGADPWARDDTKRRTPLHYAASEGSAACVKALLTHMRGAQGVGHGVRYINARSRCGLTPLHCAVRPGRLLVLQELLTHDPCLTLGTSRECRDGWIALCVGSTPLHAAAAFGNEEAVRELLIYHIEKDPVGRSSTDPRTYLDSKNSWPLQNSLVYDPTNQDLAALLNPSQPLRRALGLPTHVTPSGRLFGTGPASLATIAADALQRKLLQDIVKVRPAARAAVVVPAEMAQTVMVIMAGVEEGHTPPDTVPVMEVLDSPSSSNHGPPSGPLSSQRHVDLTTDVTTCAQRVTAADLAGLGWEVPRKDSATEKLCDVCFSEPEEVEPVDCGHRMCAGCAEELCRRMGRQPLRCPFCRREVAGLVTHGEGRGTHEDGSPTRCHRGAAKVSKVRGA